MANPVQAPAAAADETAEAMAKRAAECQAAGDSAGAIEWYGKAAKAAPGEARWHHQLGNLHQDAGRVDRAIACYRRALRASPGYAEAYNDIGSAYFTKGFLADAEKNFREAARLKPGHDVALANLGATLRRMGRYGEARRAYQRALWLRIVRRFRGKDWVPAAPAAEKARPLSADERVAEIRRLRAAGDLEQAQRQAESLVNAHPLHAESVLEHASILAERRNFAAAIEMYGRALTIRPGDAQAQLALANTYMSFGAAAEAARCLRNALQLDPKLGKARLQLGFALLSLGYPQEAEQTFREAEAQLPDDLDRRIGLALAWRDQDRVEEALAAAERIDTAAITNADTLNRLGVILMARGDSMEPAIALFRRSLQLASNPAPALMNLGLAAQQQGDLQTALRCYRSAQRVEPASQAANFNESVLQLLEGRFETGWDKYHWRTKLGGHKFNYPRFRDRRFWDGTPLAGRSLFLHGEQGLGDEIMFGSCYPEVIRQASRVVIGCDARLEALFRRSFPSAEFSAVKASDRTNWERTAPPTDLYLPCGDLPYFLRRSAEAFPGHSGYLKAAPEKVARWRERLASLGAKPKIGISWRGGVVVSWSRRRSMSLERLLPLLRESGATFINLQYGERAADIESLRRAHGIEVHDFPEAIDDLDETAALCCALDLTVTVCTTIVHMNGALGRPVWVMAPRVPEWRYGIAGERMPWYPSARIYRQQADNDWDAVLARIRTDLDAFLARRESAR